MMKIIKYTKQYKKEIEHWLALRNLPLTGAEDLPKIGLMVTHDERLVACGFLRKCEGKYLLLDSYCTNPQVSAELRNQALDILTESLILLAKSQDCKQILAYTQDQNTIKRATKHGMTATSHHVLVLVL